ncbi:MAG: aminotransferase class V-fold PLP-dependent enzyme [Acidobacteriota bacterium]
MLSAVVKCPESFAELRAREFPRLQATRLAYLDYTGSALYGESQIRAHFDLLTRQVFGNPHSENAPALASTAVIDDARRRVLEFLDADPTTYAVCFTANASAAIKLVAESYPFSAEKGLVLSADNHNSVNGLREYARRAGARVRYLPLDDELRLADPWPRLRAAGASGGGLFAFPAQSNFSGVRHPLELVAQARELGFHVLLDIAAYAPSRAFSLRECPADFAALSFYKLFGWPTGLGALIARRSALANLHRPWFAGGTVDYASVQLDHHRLRAVPDAFEDGTPDFLGIAALAAGFELIEEVGMARLSAHIARLTEQLLHGLVALRHRNGTPVVRLHGPTGMNSRGGAVAFNVLGDDGLPIGYSDVEARAKDAGVAFRGGCFCNPGAAEAAFGFDPERTKHCFQELGAEFTIEGFRDCLATTGERRAVGAVRASLGLANNSDDVCRALDVVASFGID